MKSFPFSLLLFAFVIGLLLPSTFSFEAAVDANGNVKEPPHAALTIAAILKRVDPSLDEDDALGAAALIHQARQDKMTMTTLAKMVEQNPEEVENLSKLSAPELVAQLVKTYQELVMIETLFEDPSRALQLMEESGMLPKNQVEKYKNNPKLLEHDTRKGLYFQFVTIAKAGGYV